MQILRLLSSTGARPTINIIHAHCACADDGPFFDIDLAAALPAACTTADIHISDSNSRSSDSDDSLSFTDLDYSGNFGPRSSPLHHLLFNSTPFFPTSSPPKLQSSMGRFRAFTFRPKTPTSPSGRRNRRGFVLFYTPSFASTRSSSISSRLFPADQLNSPAPSSSTVPIKEVRKLVAASDALGRWLQSISRRLIPSRSHVSTRFAARLRKSRSAFSCSVRSPSPPRCRDDSITEMQDGIERAIAHCKQSFYRGSTEREAALIRCKSDPVTKRRAINQVEGSPLG